MKNNYRFFFHLTSSFEDFKDIWCFAHLAFVTQFQPINIPACTACEHLNSWYLWRWLWTFSVIFDRDRMFV